MPVTPEVQIAVRIPLALSQRLEQEALRTGQSKRQIVIQALEKALAK